MPKSAVLTKGRMSSIKRSFVKFEAARGLFLHEPMVTELLTFIENHLLPLNHSASGMETDQDMLAVRKRAQKIRDEGGY